ncbi:SMI1/KNR4 family protein [Kordia sp.]|uniref:SMI1/KNR4 family protein n=1 Tax=Kordia sp. TaxID=1965332 RepID=UPI003D6A1F22
MNIHYLKKLKETPKVKYSSKIIKGISEEQIIKYEEQLNIKFPIAYKEFLFLAGQYSGYLTLLEGTSSIEDFADKEFQSYFKEKYLDLFNFNETRPYWVFTQGSQAFFFFYLDENIEDPEVWKVEFYEIGKHELSKLEERSRFSEFINDVVEHSIEYYREMYG